MLYNIILQVRLSFYFIMMLILLIIPGVPYLKNYVNGMGGKKEEQDSKFWKGIRIFCIVFGMVVCAEIVLVPIPTTINGVYKDIRGVIKESRCTGKKAGTLSNYGVKMVITDAEKIWDAAVLSDKKLEKGDVLEIREYKPTIFFPVVAIEVNREETEFYKDNYDNFKWDATLDRILVSTFVIINIFVHIVKYKSKKQTRSTTRKGKLFWNIWNYGCALFSILLLVCVWHPIHEVVEAYIWGYMLLTVFAIYQLAGYAHVLESVGFLWCSKDKVRRCQKGEMIKGEENLISSAQFIPVSSENAKKYCEYKYEDRQIEKWATIVRREIIFLIVGLLVFWFVKTNQKYFLAGIVGLMVLTPVHLLKSYNKKNRLIKEAFTGSCEYAIVTTDFYKNIRGSCTEGYDIIWEMDNDDNVEVKNGERAAVVYLSAINEVFTEKVDTINQLFMEEQNQNSEEE